MKPDAEVKPAINTSERLFDLVRFMRSNLHRAQLISDEEYTWLCMMSPMAISPKGGSPSRQRLEEYDEMRARLEAAMKAIEDAPHDEQCTTRFVQINRSPGEERPNLCDCWKSRALNKPTKPTP